MIRRLLGPIRPCTRIIVFGTPGSVKQALSSARWIWLILTSAALLICGFGPPRLVDREIGATERISVGELRMWADQSQRPQLSAESYMLYDLASNQVLYEQNSRIARAPASLTKLMTALLVFEKGDFESIVEIMPEDMVEGATMGLAVGDKVSVTDLLWGLLLPSGNDAASALARFVGGSSASFVDTMNRRAQALGLAESHFVNPHGLDADGHTSSTHDLLQLTRKLWEFPLFQSIVKTAHSEWNAHDLVNTNELLTTFEGTTGVKTGTTDNAGECLVATIERDGRTVILVLMGSSDRFGDAVTLYDAFRTSYSWEVADGEELSVINRVYDGSGQMWYMQPTGAAPSVLQHVPGLPEIRGFRRLQLPEPDTIVAGSQVGELEWWAGAVKVGSQALVVR